MTEAMVHSHMFSLHQIQFGACDSHKWYDDCQCVY